MANAEQASRGIFALPNEILLNVLGHFATKDLVHFAPTCRHFHSLVVRIFHHRIQAAMCLDGHTMYLECGPPAARWQQSKVSCTSLGTDGLDELTRCVQDQDQGGEVGLIRRMAGLYTRFRPMNRELDFLSMGGLRFGDIPGSRTYMAAEALAAKVAADGDVVARTIGIDADMPFSQLQTYAYLGRRESTRGLICSIQNLCEGTIRVWRDWASKQCRSKRWSDGEPVAIIHSGDDLSGKQKATESAESPRPSQNPNILWTNSGSEVCGVKFGVQEQKWQRQNPVLWTNESDVPVSYRLELQEVFIKTTHLILMLEEARSKVLEHSGQAVVLGSYTG